MLLSMFVSLILTRKLKGKVKVLVMTLYLICLPILSIGFPSIWRVIDEEMIWQVNLPTIPLSFPFHADISEVPYYTTLIFAPTPHPPSYDVKLFFLGLPIESLNFITLTTSHLIFLVSFFLLVNFAGVILGYQLNKTTIIEKLLKKG